MISKNTIDQIFEGPEDDLLFIMRKAHERVMKASIIETAEKTIIQRMFDAFRDDLMKEDFKGFLKTYEQYSANHPDAFSFFMDEVFEEAGVNDIDELFTKMGLRESFSVGDKVETKIGGKWIPATITKPPHKETGNYGVRAKVNKTIINTVASLQELRPLKENETVREGYWKDALAKAEEDRKKRQGKPFEKNPLSHDKNGVYKGDKDLAGKPVTKKMNEDFDELNEGDKVEIIGDVEHEGEIGVIERFGSGKKFVVVEFPDGSKASFHSSDVKRADDEYDPDAEEESEEEPDTFYVAFYDEDEERSWIGMVTKSGGGKWHEKRYKGEPEYRWGGPGYMSYLTPHEVMNWIHKDYRRGMDIEGPFFTPEEAEEYVENNWGGIKEKTDEQLKIERDTSVPALMKMVAETFGNPKKPKKGSLKDMMSKQSKEYWDKQPEPKIKDEMIGVAKVVKDGKRGVVEKISMPMIKRAIRKFIPGQAQAQIASKIKDQQFTQMLAKDGDPSDPDNQKEIAKTAKNIRRLNNVGKVKEAWNDSGASDANGRWAKYRDGKISADAMATWLYNSRVHKDNKADKLKSAMGAISQQQNTSKLISAAKANALRDALKRKYGVAESVSEAFKLKDKVKIIKGPKDVVGKEGFIGEIRTDVAGKKKFTIDYKTDSGKETSVMLTADQIRSMKE